MFGEWVGTGRGGGRLGKKRVLICFSAELFLQGQSKRGRIKNSLKTNEKADEWG